VCAPWQLSHRPQPAGVPLLAWRHSKRRLLCPQSSSLNFGIVYMCHLWGAWGCRCELHVSPTRKLCPIPRSPDPLMIPVLVSCIRLCSVTCVDSMLCCVPVVFDSGRCNLPHGLQLSTAPSRGRPRAELIPTEVLFSYLWLVLSSSRLICQSIYTTNWTHHFVSLFSSVISFQVQCQMHSRLTTKLQFLFLIQNALYKEASTLNHLDLNSQCEHGAHVFGVDT